MLYPSFIYAFERNEQWQAIMVVMAKPTSTIDAKRKFICEYDSHNTIVWMACFAVSQPYSVCIMLCTVFVTKNGDIFHAFFV